MAALESNREAHTHYRRAALFADRLDAAERARLFEERSTAAYPAGQVPEALAAIDTAAAAHGETGDVATIGRCARVRSRLHWYAGDGAAAQKEARAAVEILEPLGESPELARACSGLSQLAMLADQEEETLRWGERAADMAQRVGDAPTRAHALVNIGVVRVGRDPDDAAPIASAFAAADACADRHEAVRALIGEAWAQLMWVRPAAALRAARPCRPPGRSAPRRSPRGSPRGCAHSGSRSRTDDGSRRGRARRVRPALVRLITALPLIWSSRWVRGRGTGSRGRRTRGR